MALPDADREIRAAFVRALQPDPELWIDEWSEQHVTLPKGAAFEGPYRLAHTPYARRPLRALSPGDPTRRVIAMVASQLMKTQVFINAALAWIDCAPGNILALEPTDGLAKRLSSRISEAIAACKHVEPKVAAPRSRDRRNTMDCKEFDGGKLYITTAGADANLAEIAARYVFCDEVDREGWRPKTQGEGNKVKLAEARQTTFHGIAKFYAVSSPGDDGDSEIDRLYRLGTQEHYHVPCPHCGHLHELTREGLRYDFDKDLQRVDRAWFVCPECGAEIDEHHKQSMLPAVEDGGQARWVPTAAGDGETISITLSAYYAPFGSITWASLALELQAAKDAEERGDDSLMRVYVNTREGMPYKPGRQTSTIDQLVQRVAADAVPPRLVPDRALVLTMYADTQPNRLEVGIEAWGPGLERWLIDRQVLWGSPTADPDDDGSVWRQFDALRRTSFAHASGALLRVSAWGIDSGGANTQDVYNFGSRMERFGCLVTKGHSIRGRSIIASKPSLQEIDWRGQKVPDGVKLWMLGTDTAKDHIFNRLNLLNGPGALHFFQGIEQGVLEQLLAERLNVRYVAGRQIREYVKAPGAANELLDIAVGNLALAYQLGLHKWAPHDWATLRENIVGRNRTPDLFASAAAEALPADAQHQPPTTPPPVDDEPTRRLASMSLPPPTARQPAGRRQLSAGLR